MNSIHINSFEKSGKGFIYHCTIAGREKTLNKKQLLAAIEMVLREGPPAEAPIFDKIENGSRSASLMS